VSLQTPPDLLQPQRRTSITLLAVDDSVVMQEILRQYLSQYRVITTGNPAEVLPLLFQHRPHLLLMDIAMPGNVLRTANANDGIELCRIVRSLEAFKSLPILMVTSRDSLLDRIRGKWSGATGYLTKPFSESQLTAEVERLLAQAQDPNSRSLRGAQTNSPSLWLGSLSPFGDQAKA
jgi:DNA-binding response OmpR family regulator